MIRFGSVCSGIEAASVAWAPLGWRPAFFSEIDRSASAVLAYRHPDVPNLGDMTKFKDWPDAAIDLLVGGTPCQSFSVAGLRRGLDDPRGNLMLVYLAIARRYRPRWLVWENVPGVLSSNKGRDFGSLLGGLAELGYGFSYRVLDAQFIRVDGFARAVPQRRQRVFVVGHLGDWRRAAAVLFEPESLRGDYPPRRSAKEGSAAGALPGTSPGGGWRCGPDEAAAGHLISSSVARCDTAGYAQRYDAETEDFVAHVAHTLRGEGFDTSEDGTGRGTPIIPVAFDPAQITSPTNRSKPRPGAPAPTLKTTMQPAVMSSVVRRLTPRECERLQGLPDDHTRIPVRHYAKRIITPLRPVDRWEPDPAGGWWLMAADAPRYKQCGNSMAGNVMRWIGQRIALVDEIGGAA